MMLDVWTAKDLISREALKKAFEDTICIEPMPYAFVKQIIENAPTIEITDYYTGYQDGLEDGLNDIRPHGKWEKQNCFYKCSVCGVYSPDGTGLQNYCPNCGAKMDGGEE